MANMVKKIFALVFRWEKIVDYKLNEEEQAAFNKSADAVRSMNSVLSTL